MDYGALIRDAWSTTWRNRFLWILGLFAGGAIGVTSWHAGGRRPAPGFMQGHAGNWSANWGAAGQYERFSTASLWVQSHIGLLIAAGIAAALLGLGLLIISLIAQGGMAEATVDLARGQRTSLGRAWRTGTHLFWRYTGLSLILFAFAAVGAAVLGSLGFAFRSAAMATHSGLIVALGALIGIPLILVGIVAAICLTIVVAYARRAIVAENLGPVAAFQHGWNLLRAHPGASALLWLVNVALSAGAGIAVGLAMLLALGVLGGIGFALWMAAGFSAPTIAYGSVVLLALLASGMVLVAVANTFFWNYWTLAYLRLTGQTDTTPQAVAA